MLQFQGHLDKNPQPDLEVKVVMQMKTSQRYTEEAEKCRKVWRASQLN